MFDRKKRIFIGIIMTVLIVACAVSNVYLLTVSERVMPIVGTVLNLLALACAVVYCTYGYQKKASVFYKVFFLFYAIHLLTGTYGMVVDFNGSLLAAITVLAFAISFANVLMLFILDNLGKKKATVIAVINILIWFGFLLHHFIFRSDDIGIYTIRMASYLLSAILTSVLVYAKYADKEERGTT